MPFCAGYVATMRITYLLLLSVIPFARAAAQTDSASVARVVKQAGAELDSARHTNPVSKPTLQSAEVAYAVASALLGQHDYSGALTLAETATRLARDAGRGGTEVEIGPGKP